MRKLTRLSLLANALLGLAVFWLSRPVVTGPTIAPTTPAAQQPRPTALPPALSVPAPARSSPPPPATFNWSQLESTDYWTYVANLRLVGCPEQTIHDIVAADLDEAYYAHRREALQQLSADAGAGDYPAVTSAIREMGDQESALVAQALESRPPATELPGNSGSPSALPQPQWLTPALPASAASSAPAPNQSTVSSTAGTVAATTPLPNQTVRDAGQTPITSAPVSTVADNISQPGADGTAGAQQVFNAPSQDASVAALRAKWELARRNADYSLRGLLGIQRYLDYVDNQYSGQWSTAQ